MAIHNLSEFKKDYVQKTRELQNLLYKSALAT